MQAPGTLVLSAYAPCPDVTKIGDEPPDVEDLPGLSRAFTAVQKMILDGIILSVHDVSDGGFITALLEMSFAGNISFKADITCESKDSIAFLFAEEAGVFFEVEQRHSACVIGNLKGHAEVKLIGEVYPQYGPDATVEVIVNGEHVVKENLVALREVWEETSDRLGLMQTSAICLQEAKWVRSLTKTVAYSAPFHWHDAYVLTTEHCLTSAPRVAIIREEGSNGDREMTAAFTMAGFEAYDVTMTDLLSGHSLDQYRVVAFVGGFSYADVLGSAKGWAAAIRYNPVVRVEFSRFRNRTDTLSFGVCNGCQLMAHLGWVGEYEGSPSVFLAENLCGRFESVFGPVRILESSSIWLKDMAGAVLGLWSSHGEGRFVYRDPKVLNSLKSFGLIAMQYVDGDGQPSMTYPWNPNGSESSVAAICSHDGRHLAMMPHSDRWVHSVVYLNVLDPIHHVN
uniref:Glutamine amidotransferase type-1 domain-containing protein n=1 Tax=Angiostrongylus cantonensis TaxID=6313 RepID=A0A158PBH7_ANGCA